MRHLPYLLLTSIVTLLAPGRAHACSTAYKETPGNGTDEDCDGWDAIRRDWLEDFSGPSGEWSFANRTADTDVLWLASTGASAATASWTGSVAYDVGKPYLLTRVSGRSGSGTCGVDVTTDTGTFSGTLNGVGLSIYDMSTALGAPSTITDVDIHCSIGSTVWIKVDWMSIQNSDYEWPPVQDVGVTWTDMEMPGGGASTAVFGRRGNDNAIYVGSDVGGLAVSSDYGDSWSPINGDPADMGFLYSSDYAVWGMIDAPSPGDNSGLWAITGQMAGTSCAADHASTSGATCELEGAVWHSSDFGDTWDQVYTSYSDDIAARGRMDWCQSGGGGDASPFSFAKAGGKLLEYEPGQDVLYMASHVDGAETVHVRDSAATPETCAPYDDLPTDGLVGALQVVTDSASSKHLIVGYKDGNSGDGLWVCDVRRCRGHATDVHEHHRRRRPGLGRA